MKLMILKMLKFWQLRIQFLHQLFKSNNMFLNTLETHKEFRIYLKLIRITWLSKSSKVFISWSLMDSTRLTKNWSSILNLWHLYLMALMTFIKKMKKKFDSSRIKTRRLKTHLSRNDSCETQRIWLSCNQRIWSAKY